MKFLITSVFFLLMGLTVKSQVHGEVKWIEGKKYTYHQVKTQETLYGISKKYGVRISEILLSNPEAIEGIKPEMLLVMPPVKVLEDATERVQLQGNLLYHEVKAQETIYGICQEYGVEEDDLKRVNDLSDGLKVGARLIIPFEDELAKLADEDSLSGKKVIKSEMLWGADSAELDSFDLNVALILPLYLDENDSIEINKEETDDPRLPKYTPISLQFMSGVYMALDSITKQGYDIRLNVIDSKPDALDFKKQLDENSFSTYDLVIGPVVNEYFDHFMQKKDSGQYAILAPFSKDTSILNNPRIIKSMANRQSEIDCIGKYLGENKGAANIVFVYESTTKPDYAEVEYLQKEMTLSALSHGKDSLIRMPRRANFRSLGLNGIVTNFTDTLENIVVVLSQSQSFLTSMMQKLEPFVEDFEITIYGTSQLAGYQSFEPELFEYLHVHTSSIGNLNLRDSMYLDFERDYFFRFGEIPSLQAVQAFEQTLFVGEEIAKHGYYSPGVIDGQSYQGIYSDFNFKWVESHKGVENQTAFMIKFSDYQFLRINE